jgi:BirA family transcriptional regulator, biotin operon repressor / biotin---[acetyl-CoA-carboxylase] ligase
MTVYIGNPRIELTEVDSTNNYATQMVSEGAWEPGTVVIAHAQPKGKGLLTNKWESEAGKNITLSVLLAPEFLPIPLQFQISKVVSLAVYQVVSMFAPNAAIKWPNDVYIGSNKVAGILIENSIMGSVLNSSVVGIGLNVNQVEFRSDAPNPVSLAQVLGCSLELSEVIQILLDRFNELYAQLEDGHSDKIDSMYLDCLYRKGIWAQYSDKLGTYNGKILGVSEIGMLQIERENGTVSEYHFKEVVFL